MSGGFPYEVDQQASRDLYCLICLNLMRDATQLTCGHGMCKTCLEDLEKSSIERYCSSSKVGNYFSSGADLGFL